MNKLHEERDRLAHAHRSRSDVYNEDWNSFNSFKAGFDASTEIHQHLVAEKDKRIERLEHCLEWLAAGFGGMWGSESKMWYDHALETAPDMIKAALQEETK